MYYTRGQSRNKYGAIRQTYNGYNYASKRESTKAWELDQLVKAGEIKSWERQAKVELYGINGSHICDYKVDFLVTHNDGLLEFIEVKSPITATGEWRIKWRLLEDKYGKDCKYKLSVEY